MAIVKINKIRTLADIEQAHSKVENGSVDDKFIFTLGSYKARYGPMHDASRLQLMSTLARKYSESCYVEVHENASLDSAVKSICSYSPGIAAIRMSKGMRIGEQVIGRRDVLKEAIKKMHDTDAANFNSVIHGRSLDLICVSGSKVQYLRPLFAAPGVVKEHAEMSVTMKNLADVVNKQSSEKVPESLFKSLGLFSSELIKNTQEHAVSDYNGKPYLSHVEGLILGWTRLKAEFFSKDFLGHDALLKYWEKEVDSSDSGGGSLRVFGVSYFDSGPGFVSRYTGKPVTEFTIEKEKSLLLECLKHKTTSKSEDASGEGLASVLSELKKVGGLIRIRSGRLSVFNAFDRNNADRDIFAFEDWSNTELAPVQGAVISILVPLRAN